MSRSEHFHKRRPQDALPETKVGVTAAMGLVVGKSNAVLADIWHHVRRLSEVPDARCPSCPGLAVRTSRVKCSHNQRTPRYPKQGSIKARGWAMFAGCTDEMSGGQPLFYITQPCGSLTIDEAEDRKSGAEPSSSQGTTGPPTRFGTAFHDTHEREGMSPLNSMGREQLRIGTSCSSIGMPSEASTG